MISLKYIEMVVEAITNFDSYVWVAVGLFITGLFAIMVYEGSTTSKAKQYHRQQPGTSSKVE
jgi:hypothetical protein